MPTQNLIHIQLTQIGFLIIMVGLLCGSGSKAKAEDGGGTPRIDIFHPQNENHLKTIEGEVTRVQGQFAGEKFSLMRDERYRILTPWGSELDLLLEKNTRVVGDIFLGDHVQATVGEDGLLHTVQKIDQKRTKSQQSEVLRRVTGTVERMDGNFLFVRNQDHIEILHLDKKSSLEEGIREGSTITAQLGDAGYAIKIQKLEKESSPNPD